MPRFEPDLHGVHFACSDGLPGFIERPALIALEPSLEGLLYWAQRHAFEQRAAEIERFAHALRQAGKLTGGLARIHAGHVARV
jgi:hypothetical protein